MLTDQTVLTTFFPTLHHCQWCGNTHYGLCPQSVAPAIDVLDTQVQRLQDKVIELEELIQYLNTKLNRHSKQWRRRLQGDPLCPAHTKSQRKRKTR